MTKGLFRIFTALGLMRNTKRDSPTPIVPAGGITGMALMVVIAIMTFLGCLAVGGVNLVNQSAANWEGQISSEATIQIRPIDGQNMQENLIKAVRLVKKFDGVVDARILDEEATKRLLEPWLGSGLDLNDLPVPRLIIVTLGQRNEVNFPVISQAIQKEIPGGSFDDHGTWIERLVMMAHASVVIGLVILILVLIALGLTVVFATRGSLSGNAPIVEVLHFIGAENRFIARQFGWHFLRTGFRGAIYGGIAAVVTFFICSLWAAYNMATPGADQATALFGNFMIGWKCYLEMAALVIFVSSLTMITSRITIMRQLRGIDGSNSNLF